MEQTNLNSKSIYLIPGTTEDVYWLYAPLSGAFAEIQATEAISFENSLALGVIPESLANIIYDNCEPADYAMPAEIGELVILLNQRCNFSCSYCYSAKGRNGAELNSETLHNVLGWFITENRAKVNNNNLSITFSGGGDPTLSFDILKDSVLYAREQANAISINIHIGLVCNGSSLDREKMAWIRDNIDNIVISCDIIEEVHNEQRSDFSIVAQTINELCDIGANIGIRSTVTPLCVDRMTEMVDTMHQTFPMCKSIAMEAVLTDTLWDSPASLKNFYDSFIENLWQAIRYGQEIGIEVGNTLLLSVNGLKSRSCLGKLVITPQGYLTACSRISSRQEKHFDHFVFGEIRNGRIEYDLRRYIEVMQQDNIRRNECYFCFAKYHCGGGCALVRCTYTPA